MKSSEKKKGTPNKTVFSYTPQNELPPLAPLTYEWDLKALFYASERDPRIEKDVLAAIAAYHAFAKKYRNANFTSNLNVLVRALRDYVQLVEMPELSRPSHYFAYRRSLSAHDSTAEKQSNLISNRMTKAHNEILFFKIAVGKIPKATQKTLLKDPAFSEYRYYLEQIFEHAKHRLSEPEEKVLNLCDDTSYEMWVDGTEKIAGRRSIQFGKKTLPLNEAIESLDLYPPKERTKLWHTITKELGTIAEVSENEFNAIISYKRTIDELRGFTKPYEATVLGYENKLGSVEALISSMSTKGFALSRDFYAYKASLHGAEHIAYEHKYEPIGTIPSISYETAITVCRDAFYGLNQTYGELFDTIVTRGQIDVYPKEGKRGGAFMSSGIKQPTLVFLNHTNTFKSLETLAHEMGHAVHAERSKLQPTLYEGHSITTAETASTFFENLVLNTLLKHAREEDKVILLHDKITRDIATLERQIAFFNCELEIHNRVREHGAVTKEELREMTERHLRSYLGKGVLVRPEDGYSFVYIHHFRYGFYVYTYTYGLLMSSLMHVRLKDDPGFVKNIDTFLTAGGKASVEAIFKEIGIDPLKIETFNEALELHKADITEFKRITKHLKNTFPLAQ